MFAPYQQLAPDEIRAQSPPQNPRPSISSTRSARTSSPPAFINPSRYSPRSFWRSDDVEAGGDTIDLFTTKIGLRLDVEAPLAYLFFPPIGAIFLLIFEDLSDYVRYGICWKQSGQDPLFGFLLFALFSNSVGRYHAWQATMLSVFMAIVHFFLLWSPILTYVLFVCDVLLMAKLTHHAYRDASTLDRYQIPIIGQIANSFVDDD